MPHCQRFICIPLILETTTIADSEDETETATADTGSVATEPSQATGTATVVQQRRELLDSKLKDFRQVKLKRKIPVDAQLLDCAREDLQVKKKLVDQMEKLDKQHTENLTKLTGNMEKLTNSIADGFALLRSVLAPPQTQPMYPRTNHHFTIVPISKGQLLHIEIRSIQPCMH